MAKVVVPISVEILSEEPHLTKDPVEIISEWLHLARQPIWVAEEGQVGEEEAHLVSRTVDLVSLATLLEEYLVDMVDLVDLADLVDLVDLVDLLDSVDLVDLLDSVDLLDLVDLVGLLDSVDLVDLDLEDNHKAESGPVKVVEVVPLSLDWAPYLGLDLVDQYKICKDGAVDPGHKVEEEHHSLNPISLN